MTTQSFFHSDKSELAQDAKKLLATLVDRNSNAEETRSSLEGIRRELGWDEDKVDRAKDFLRNHGRIDVLQGGSMWRTPIIGWNERDYYDPIIDELPTWLETVSVNDTRILTLGSRVNNPGRKDNDGEIDSSGKWQNPDVVMYRLTRHKYFPGRALEAWSFEVKARSGMDSTAVYEATAHYNFHHYSCVILVLPTFISLETPGYNGDKIKEIERTCRETGVGLLVVIEPDVSETWKLLIQPMLHFPNPAIISQNIERLKLADGSIKDKLEIWCGEYFSGLQEQQIKKIISEYIKK
jgi:hypothetical protein